MKQLYFFSIRMVFGRIPYYTFSSLLRKKTGILLISVSWLWLSHAVFAATTINVSTISTSLALTTGDYTITGTNTGSSLGTGTGTFGVFTVASGQTVTITLDNVNFTTTNTASTKFIDCASGANVNIILKGTNVFDGHTLTASSNVIGFAGAGTLTLSEHSSGGSLRMKVAPSGSTQLQTIGYNPSGTAGKLIITGGIYSTENTGSGTASGVRVLGTGGSGTATATISGGTFMSINSGSGTHTGAILYLNSGSATAGISCKINGGSFSTTSGSVVSTASGKVNNITISGGTFTNNGTSSLFVNSGIGTMSINSPVDRFLHLTDKNGTIITLSPGSTDATTISNYTTSLNVAPCYVVRFYSGTDKTYVHTQESDVSAFTLDKYSRSWFSVNSLGNWMSSTGTGYTDNSPISFTSGSYILDLYPVLSSATFIDVSTLTSSLPLTTGEYVLYGDNTGTGSTIPTSIFTIASGNTVTVTLYDMKFKTNNTAATKLIDAASGSNMNLILKGDNVYDGKTLTSASNAISMAGGGLFNFSVGSSSGSLNMKVAAGSASTQFQTIGYNPSGTTGILSITGGGYYTENTGNIVYSNVRVLGTGGSGSALLNISGGAFELINSGSAAGFPGYLIYLNSGGVSAGVTCKINGGQFQALDGHVYRSADNKSNTLNISYQGSFYNNGENLFLTGSGSKSSITGPTIVTVNNGYIKTLASSSDTISRDTLSTYKSSLTLAPTADANMAYNRSVLASSYYGNYNILKAFDGDLDSRWITAVDSIDNQWVQIDLGSIRTFDRLIILEYTSNVRQFEIVVSNDLTNWNKVYSGTFIPSNSQIIFSEISARYIRIRMIHSTDRVSLVEIGVFYKHSQPFVVKGNKMLLENPKGPFTKKELEYFKAYIKTSLPLPTNNYTMTNDLCYGTSGLGIEGMGLIYQITGDTVLLNRMIAFCDNMLYYRNDMPGGDARVMFTGKVEPCWPNNPTGLAASGYAASENGDILGHIYFCAHLILRSFNLLNYPAPSTDLIGNWGTTYLDRAKRYIELCDQTMEQFIVPNFIDNQYRESFPSTQGWKDLDGGTSGSFTTNAGIGFPVNQQMMFNNGFIGAMECYRLLEIKTEKQALYKSIIQTSIDWVSTGLTIVPARNTEGYLWYYNAPNSPKQYVEDIGHAAFSFQTYWKVYQNGLFDNMNKEKMIRFSNTLKYTMYDSINYVYTHKVNGDPTAGLSYYPRAGWIFLSAIDSSLIDYIYMPGIINKLFTDAGLMGHYLFIKSLLYGHDGVEKSSIDLTDQTSTVSSNSTVTGKKIVSNVKKHGLDFQYCASVKQLYIKNSAIMESINIFDNKGTCVMTYKPNSGSCTLNLTSLSNGIYLIRIDSVKHNVFKIVI